MTTGIVEADKQNISNNCPSNKYFWEFQSALRIYGEMMCIKATMARYFVNGV